MKFGSQLLFPVLFYFHILSQGLVHIHLYVFLNQKRNSALRLLKTEEKSSMFHSQSGASPISFLVPILTLPKWECKVDNSKKRRCLFEVWWDFTDSEVQSKANIFQAGNLSVHTPILIYLFLLFLIQGNLTGLPLKGKEAPKRCGCPHASFPSFGTRKSWIANYCINTHMTSFNPRLGYEKTHGVGNLVICYYRDRKGLLFGDLST